MSDDSRKPDLASEEQGPVTEADLHALVDGQLTAARLLLVQEHLAHHAVDRARVMAWQHDAQALRDLLNPVLDEPVPEPMRRVGDQPQATPALPWPLRVAAAAGLLALGLGMGWGLRGQYPADGSPNQRAEVLPDFAQRAAVAHAVFSPEVRHPVEVGVDQEQHLVRWLSKRLGSDVKVPVLAPLGYQLVGGRLLPGERSAVAQFMYQNANGQRLTLYVTREVPTAPGQPETAFSFGHDGPTQVFYWVDKSFGYALSSTVDRDELHRVSTEVYRQLER